MSFNNQKFLQIMLFYSFLTFYLGPKLAKHMKTGHKDPCMVGMIAGFFVSLVLWKKYGYNMTYGTKNT